jgi:hypothetical protein
MAKRRYRDRRQPCPGGRYDLAGSAGGTVR